MTIINNATGQPVTLSELEGGGVITGAETYTFTPGADEHTLLGSEGDKGVKIAIIGAGRPLMSLQAALLAEGNALTARLINGFGADNDGVSFPNYDEMAMPGSPVEGKHLRGDGRRELVMNEAGTMTWPAPKPRRGRR